ncbi:hypothetical protein J7E73_18575 [Paenibacillus albidus]|uniref:hypothetical protein n=1 Tax=Paenibacillus albidus TaxID=2041023 RepID=UPI001BE9D035|nr:hypothetical protein [Paenibacillus albidus]MBT2291108.1 hypothetical protein [Paenibacillus albidus]
MKRITKRVLLGTVSALLFYILFIPLPTPELTIRRYLLFRSPITALTGDIIEGQIKNDPKYGNLYVLPKVELSFIYVQKNNIGWYVTTQGTAP